MKGLSGKGPFCPPTRRARLLGDLLAGFLDPCPASLVLRRGPEDRCHKTATALWNGQPERLPNGFMLTRSAGDYAHIAVCEASTQFSTEHVPCMRWPTIWKRKANGSDPDWLT